MATTTASATTRRYRMRGRAAAVERTRRRIIDAAIEISARDFSALTLASVAAAAGVSARTVVRQFGSRDGLVAAVAEEAGRRVAEQRFAAPAGDVDAIAANLLDHYEQWGDRAIAMLAQEGSGEEVDRTLASARKMHRRWAHEKLGPLLTAREPGARRRTLAQLVAITDVYTWKLLRRDQGLGRGETEKAIAEMIRGLKGVES